MQPFTRKAETPFQLNQPHLQETCVRNQNTLIIGGYYRAKVRRKPADTYLNNLPIFTMNARTPRILMHLAQQIADYLRRTGERGIELGRILPARFGQIRPSAAGTAHA
jgi:hypothetical protein